MPNAEYRLTPKARADLIGIWDFGASQWGRAQADAYIRALADTFALIARFPAMAPLRMEFTPPMRLHAHGPHLILYIEETDILIARILHNRQNLLAALDG